MNAECYATVQMLMGDGITIMLAMFALTVVSSSLAYTLGKRRIEKTHGCTLK